MGTIFLLKKEGVWRLETKIVGRENTLSSAMLELKRHQKALSETQSAT